MGSTLIGLIGITILLFLVIGLVANIILRD
jgi:hypothetical protein